MKEVSQLIPMFETDLLQKSYRGASGVTVDALYHVSISIPAGQWTLVTGSSGSGKSTLLALLGALERPTSGRIVFDGAELNRCSGMELARIRRKIGFVFQDFSLIPGLSVLDNIIYPLIPHGINRKERISRAEELLKRFGLKDRMFSEARELSGGEQQRIAVIRALAGRPKAIIADEPTSNLDPKSAQIVLDTFSQVVASGTTVVMSSHDPSLVEKATLVIRLQNGRRC